MRTSSIARFALAAAFVAVAAAPAAAQSAVRETVRPAVAAAREVAKYNFTVSRDAGLPAEVTVADVGGALAASYRLPGQRAAAPMLIQVLDTDIVLQAETEQGVLTLQLFKQNDSDEKGVVGTWTLGSRSGELRGKATR